MEYRREIDGLRALAVIPVILFHAGFSAFSGGFVGVDVFFVLSGYLITSIINNDLESGKFSIINFYERRARRILPALFLVILICIPFAWLWFLPNEMKDFSQSIVAILLFSSNILFWRESGYFDISAELKPLLHTWSLSVEEQYYLLFPLFLILSRRLAKRWILLILAIVASSSLALSHSRTFINPAEAFYSLPTRGWELLIGVFAAYYLSKAHRPDFSRCVSETGGSLGLVLIVYSILAFNKETPFPGLYALVPTVGTLLIILFATNQTTIGGFIGNRFFVGIGLVSYSAYLWHQPLFAFARHRINGDLSILLMITLSLATFLLAYLSWKYVEQPFRSKQNLDRKAIFNFAAVGGGLFSLFSAVIILNKGLEHRFEKSFVGDVGHLEFHEYIDQKFIDCEPKQIANQALSWDGFLRCKQSKTGLPDIILLGDSHAESLFIGLAEAIANYNIAFYIQSGKPYIDNPEFKAIFKELLTNRKPQHILLAFDYTGRLSQGKSDLTDRYSTTIRALLESGKKISLLGDVPRFRVEPGFCLYKVTHRDSSLCSIRAHDVEIQRSTYRPVLRLLSSQYGVPYIDIDNPLCSNLTCSMTSAGKVLYRDTHHLNIIGSKIVGSYVAEALFMK